MKYFIFLLGLCFFSLGNLQSANSQMGFDLFSGKDILVIGGTGYLGNGVIEKILEYNPRKVIAFSRDEVKHFRLSQKFGHYKNVESVIGDIRDYQAVVKAMNGMDIVVHCAALKRMDCIESNVARGCKNKCFRLYECL